MHSGWDQHGNLFTQLEQQCHDTDLPSAALVKDLKQRGLLEDTLVTWGGEFGRTPFGQGDPNKPNGRDHFGRAYSWWLAGAGVKPGNVFGATEFGHLAYGITRMDAKARTPHHLRAEFEIKKQLGNARYQRHDARGTVRPQVSLTKGIN